jgi:hypothetical protein
MGEKGGVCSLGEWPTARSGVLEIHVEVVAVVPGDDGVLDDLQKIAASSKT